MMKKIVSAVLLVCLLFSVSNLALAEFSLRNGYTWGMSKEDALALAKEEGLGENTSKGESVAAFENVMVGNISFEMVLSFDEDLTLTDIWYKSASIPEDNKEEYKALFDSLAASLEAVYGPFHAQWGYIYLKWMLPDTEITLMEGFVLDDRDVINCTIYYTAKPAVKNSGF